MTQDPFYILLRGRSVGWAGVDKGFARAVKGNFIVSHFLFWKSYTEIFSHIVITLTSWYPSYSNVCCFSFPTVSLLLHYYICAHIHVFHKVFDVTIFLNLFPFLFWSQVYKIILWFSFILGWNFLSSFVFFLTKEKKLTYSCLF